MQLHEQAASALETMGLNSRYGRPQLMTRCHRHNEVELNLIEAGTTTYLFGGASVTIAAGRLALFWGAVPHQLVQMEHGTIFHWVTLPLAWFLQLRLPEPLTRQILGGVLVVDPAAAPAGEQHDRALFRQWHADLQAPSAERHAIVILEVEARLRRLALALDSAGVQPGCAAAAQGTLGRGELTTVEQIAQVIAERYTEQLSVGAIALAVGVHPNYAMNLFRKTFGVSLGEYLIQHRVLHAQRLLATTDLPVLEIALESGFGSASRFYAAFRRACAQSPRAYRQGLRGDRG